MSIALPYQKQKPASSPGQLWLCIRLPMLALNSLGVRFASDKAVAVSDKQQILQANQVAERGSVRPSQSIEHARMLMPSLCLIERDPKLETNKLTFLSEWAYRFTSHVHIYNEHTLLLEIGRSLKLFKGLKHLEHLITQQLHGLGMDAKFGLADTPKAAHLLSHGEQTTWGVNNIKEALRNAQLKHLSVDKKIIGKLQHCGFHSLSDILHIPLSELGARFGKEFVHYLDQLLGRVPDPVKIVVPKEVFLNRVDFAEPIHNRTWIEQQIQRLLKDLIRFIQSRNVVCRCFTWRFYSEKNQLIKQIDIPLNSAANDFDTLLMLTELQFESMDIQWAFSCIELASEALFEKQHYHQDLFRIEYDQEKADTLFDKLSSRLGPDALYKVSAKAEHLPELVNQRCEINHFATNHEIAVSDFKDEPLCLLEQPKRLVKQANRPIHHGPLNLLHGPHRITSHWWSTLHSRDYYMARQVSGRLLWIYYDRKQHNWYLHGLFA